MRSSFVSHRGLALMKTPTARQEAGRRRLLVACAMAGLALAAGGLGALTPAPGDLSDKAGAGPFSYFPTP